MSVAATSGIPSASQPSATQNAEGKTTGNSAISAQLGAALGSFCSVMEAIGGWAIANPALDLAAHVPAGGQSASTSTVQSESGYTGTTPVTGMPTAAQIASQIVQAMGGNGQISLSDVEKVMADTPAGAVANSMANVDADFKKLSGGGDTLTERQLTSGIQSFMNEGGFTNAYKGGSSMVVNGVATGRVTSADGITYPAAAGSVSLPLPWEEDSSSS